MVQGKSVEPEVSLNVQLVSDGLLLSRLNIPAPSSAPLLLKTQSESTGLLLKSASAGDFAVDIDLDPLGRFLVVATPNSKDLTHVDLTPGTNFFKATRFPTTTSRFFSVALTPDGSQAIAVGNGSATANIYAFDTSTRKVVWSVKNTVSGAAIAVR